LKDFVTIFVENINITQPQIWNYDVVYCSQNVQVKRNAGFWVGLSLFGFCALFLALYSLAEMNSSRKVANSSPIPVLKTEAVDGAAVEEKDVQVVIDEKQIQIPTEQNDRKQTEEQPDGFCVNFFNVLVDNHLIFSAFFPTKNNTKPRLLRIILLFLVLTLEFFFNALFYSDTLIMNRNYYYNDADRFWSVIVYQIGKSAISIAIALTVYVIWLIIAHFMQKQRNALIISAMGFFCLVSTFAWYYDIAFCTAYPTTQGSWFNGAMLSFLIDFCILQLVALPFVLTIMKNGKSCCAL